MTIAMGDRFAASLPLRMGGTSTVLRRVLAIAALLVLATILVFTARAIGSWLSGTTRISVVSVEGTFGESTRADIERSLAARLEGHSLLDVPLSGVADELRALSWVAGVDVFRVWPTGLVVRVTEKVPVARWNGEAFIAHNGEVFQPENPRDIGNLPFLEGPADKASQVMAFYQQANAILVPYGLDIDTLTLDEQFSWEIVTDTGIRIRVDQQEGAARLRRFLKVYEKHLAPVAAQVGRVDLRYIGGFAVQWTPASGREKPASTGAIAPGGHDGQNASE